MFNYYYNFRVDEKTRQELIFLSESLQRTKSNLLRWLVHQEYLRWEHDALEGTDAPLIMIDSNQGGNDEH